MESSATTTLGPQAAPIPAARVGFSRRRRALPILLGLLAAASVAMTGCGRPAYATAPQPSTAAASPPSAVAATSPPTMAQPTAEQPPVPVPATFDVADLAERVKPVVVNITTTHDVAVPAMGFDGGGFDPFDFFFGGRGQPMQQPREMHAKQTALGTGFIIDPSGYVATNNHVVEGADTVVVKLADDREFQADVVGRDPKLDVALLKLKGASNLPTASLGSSERLRVGEHVLAVGNPFGLGHTVTLGIVSAKARTIGAGPYDDFIQTDASINPGNSGGPLFNWKGEVVGINTAIRAGANGIGFAIPVDELKDVLPQLREKGHVDRGKLGLAFQPITSDLAKAMKLDSTHGALVADVEPGGSAARAGIKPGDIIVAVNGTPIRHAEELPRNVARNPPGASIKVTVQRGNEKRDVTATLDALNDGTQQASVRRPASGDAQQPQSRLGLEVSDAPGGGARIDGVSDAGGDLQPGDVIVEFAGAKVSNVGQLRTALAKVKPGTTIVAKVRRGPMTRFAAVTVPR